MVTVNTFQGHDTAIRNAAMACYQNNAGLLPTLHQQITLPQVEHPGLGENTWVLTLPGDFWPFLALCIPS